MSGLTTATWNAYLDDIVGTTARTAPTTPMKLRLETVAGTAAAVGTEATGYTPPSIAFGAAASASINNSGALTVPFTATNAVVSLFIADSAGTPVRKLWGPLAATKNVVNGDSLAFAAGSIVITGTS